MKKNLLALIIFSQNLLAQDELGLIVNNKGLGKEEIIREINAYEKAANNQMPISLIRQQALNEIIIRELIKEISERANITASDDEINEAMRSIAKQNNMTISQLLQKVKLEFGLQESDFKKRMEHEVFIQKIKQGIIVPDIQITPEEIDEQIAQFAYAQETKLHVEDLLLPLPDGSAEERAPKINSLMAQVSKTLATTNHDLQRTATILPEARYNNLGLLSLTQVPPRFARVLANLPLGEVSSIPIIDADGMHFLRVIDRTNQKTNFRIVEANVAHILVRGHDKQAREKINAVYEKLKQNPHDFNILAGKYSDDTLSAVNGGELGLINETDVVPEFARQIKTAPLHTVTAPFETEYGWHVMTIHERREINNSDTVLRQRVHAMIFERKLEEKWQKYLQDLREQTYIDVRL